MFQNLKRGGVAKIRNRGVNNGTYIHSQGSPESTNCSRELTMARGELPSLPEEIMVEILSRLPAKSIGQFRCVAKPWRVLLSDPQFINTHLNNRRTEENLILILKNQSIHTIADVGDYNVSRTIRFQSELPETWNQVVGSCNGLVLLLTEEDALFLKNPTTLREVKIPDLPGFKRESISVHGFGYDAATDDYKIVAISNRDMDNDYQLDPAAEHVLQHSFVYMYSMKRGIWKRLERFPYYHAVSIPDDICGFCPGAYVNGSIHWLAYAGDTKYSSVIAAFDLVDEKFKEISIPGCFVAKIIMCNVLSVLKGCLCMFDKNIRDGVDQIDIWIMEEYGVQKSWVKLRVSLDRCWWNFKPLCFIGDDKIVLEINWYRFSVYEFKTGTWRNFIVDGVPVMSRDGGTFVESLIWPTHGDLM